MPRTEQRHPEIQVGVTGVAAETRPEWVERKGDRVAVTQVIATWAEGGQGPAGRVFANRLNRTFFRLKMENGAIYEVAHELPENRKAGARWVLIRQLQSEDNPSTAEPARPRAAPAKRKAPAPTPSAKKAPRPRNPKPA